MAAAECVEGKSVETVKFSYSPSLLNAISWSPDGRISVITDQCIYVLTPISSPSHPGLNLERTSVLRHKEPSHVDVGISRKEITEKESSEWRLDPNVNSLLLKASCFQKVAWSPLNCDRNGRCVISTVFSDYQLRIHMSPSLGTQWKEAFNLSPVLSAYLKENNFKIEQDIMEPALEQPNLADQVFINKTYAQFFQRAQMLAFTSLHWFSEIYQPMADASPTEPSISEDGNQFAILATGTQSGHIVFWKVAIPIRISNSDSVQLGGFLQTQQSWPCSLSWKQLTDNQGLLAVGSIDGYVKVFSMSVLPSLTAVAQYVLWGDKDDMQVQCLEWLPSLQVHNSCCRLIACKGSSVIIFSMNVKDGILLQKPTQRIITKVHRMPISGLSCTQNGTIFTCSVDNAVQMIADDAAQVKSVKYDAKKTFLCSGIGASAHGAFFALFLSPSNHTHQSLETHQTRILFVNIACELPSIVQLLNKENVEMSQKWDVCKALQYFIHLHRNTKDIQLVAAEALETLSYTQLFFRQHILSLMILTLQNDEQDASKRELAECSAQHESTVSCMYKSLALARLKHWLEGRELGSINQADSVSALLMCDWLVLKYSDSDVVDLVTKVYQACDDADGLNMVSSFQRKSEGNDHKMSSSEHPEMELTLQGQEPDGTRNVSEPVGEQMDTNPNSSQVDLLENTCNNIKSLPAREKCQICEAAIPMESETYGTCLNGHKWQRCCVLFTVCENTAARCCQDCGRCVSVPCPGLSPWMQKVLQATSRCPFCLGFFRVLF